MIKSAKEAREILNLKHDNCADYRQMEARGYIAALEGPEVKELLDYLELWKFSNGELLAKELLSKFREAVKVP